MGSFSKLSLFLKIALNTRCLQIFWIRVDFSQSAEPFLPRVSAVRSFNGVDASVTSVGVADQARKVMRTSFFPCGPVQLSCHPTRPTFGALRDRLFIHIFVNNDIRWVRRWHLIMSYLLPLSVLYSNLIRIYHCTADFLILRRELECRSLLVAL